MFRVVVAGGRDFSDYVLLCEKLDMLLRDKVEVMIISGGASGADRLGERYAKARGLALSVQPADWEKHGRGAGFIRNGEMLVECDAVVAFWDGKSRGTAHMIRETEKSGKPYRVIRYGA